MMTILEKIVENTKRELALEKKNSPFQELRRQTEAAAINGPSFYDALCRGGIRIVAEVKKASPSKGVICEEFDPVAISRDYHEGGAAAISVLTDKTFFQGNLSYLDDIAKSVELPLLRKDFIIDPYQIYQAKMHGASAILLLASVLDMHQLTDFIAVAGELQLDALLEVHNQPELEVTLKTPAKIIGINNRDLKSFRVDLSVSEDLIKNIPPGFLKVSESGIFSHAHIKRLQGVGFDAFLVGESLMKETNRIKMLKRLRGASC